MVKIILFNLFSEISEIVQKVHLIFENITQTGMQQANMVDLLGGVAYVYIQTNTILYTYILYCIYTNAIYIHTYVDINNIYTNKH